MPDFENKLCPACRAAFNKHADIVVCPECGTPHHRTCYLAKGHCALEQYHAKGFVWSGSLPDENPPEPTVNTDPHYAEYPAGAPQPKARIHLRRPEEFETAEEYFAHVNRVFSDDERGEDGVSLHELCAYTAKSINHFGQAFSLFRGDLTGRKSSIFLNLCSGLFMPVYQFYRKMDLLGIISLILGVGLMIPEIIFSGGLVDVETLSRTAQAMVSLSYYLCNLFGILLMVILCLFGDYFYYKHAIKQIKKIRSSFGDNNTSPEYFAALVEKGKPSWPRAIIGILLLMIAVASLRLLPMLFSA